MKRLLFISHRVPYPPDKGERVRAFHEIQALAGHFRITLAALSQELPRPPRLGRGSRLRRVRPRCGTSAMIAILVAGAAAGALAPAPASAVGDPPIVVAFRYDDFSARSPTPLEVDLIRALQSHGARCTFAAIPFVCEGTFNDPAPQPLLALGDAKLDVLRAAVAAGVAEVALHGYSHQTIRPRSEGGCAEWEGLDARTQAARLAEGKATLERLLGVEVTTFIPPWNRYDGHTLAALEEQGFRCLSASYRGPCDGVPNLSFLPATHDEIRGLCEAVQEARRVANCGRIIVVQLHPFTFGEGRVSWEEFTGALDWLQAQPHVRFMTVGQAAAQVGQAGAQTFKNNRRRLMALRLLPPWLRGPAGGEAVFVIGQGQAGAVRRAWLWTLSYFAVILGLSGAAAWVGGRSLRRRSVWSRLACPMAAFLLTGVGLYAWAVPTYTREYAPATAAVAMVGLAGGCLLGLRRGRPALAEGPLTLAGQARRPVDMSVGEGAPR